MQWMTIIRDRELSLEEAQQLVGGYVGALNIDSDRVLLFDEDGLLKGLEPNRPASVIAGRRMVGPCVLLRGKRALDGWKVEA